MKHQFLLPIIVQKYKFFHKRHNLSPYFIDGVKSFCMFGFVAGKAVPLAKRPCQRSNENVYVDFRP